MRHSIAALSALLCLAPLLHAAQLGDELLQNGDFEKPAANGTQPAGWSWGAGARWATAGGNHWVVEDLPAVGTATTNQTVPLEERYWKIRVSCRVRVTNVVLGAEGWNDARIAMSFYDADGEQVGGWPNVLHFVGTMADWETHERDYLVPPGARELRMSCSVFSATGKAEWDDVSVKLLKFDPVPEDAKLPPGVTARWDLANAYREETPTRGRVCINGLWRFHPVSLKETELPAAGTGWGYLKVPGTWAPGKSWHTPIGPDIWEDNLELSKIDAAWYQREVTVPGAWRGRRLFVNVDNPKHSAHLLIDGKDAGLIDWPGGRVDVTALLTPGKPHTLSVHTVALAGDAEKIVVMEPDQLEKARQEVNFKGLCGDCWLESEPTGPRLGDVFVKPSVKDWKLGLQCELGGLQASGRYRLSATVREGDRVVKEFSGALFAGTPRAELAGDWRNPKLWDLDQPNLYTVSVQLRDEGGRVLDETTPVQFGFREFRIDGKDFTLNGTRIHLRCLDYSNASRDFGLASYPAARETLRRAREIGFNYVLHANYDYDAQDFTCLDDTVRAGDDAGFPMSFSIRHVKRIYRDFEDPQKRAFWNRAVDYEVRRLRNHPSIFMWAMDHNFTGWQDDQNPQQMDGRFAPSPQDDPGLAERRKAATLAEQYVMDLDGTRPCYHHQSGPFNQMTTLNCYLCWTPLQERQEWLSRWRDNGVKPLFFVEFGLPHQASWGGHREGPFIWRNNVNSEPFTAEFGAMYNGDGAYDLTDYDLVNQDAVEQVYARGAPFHLSQVLANYWSNRWEHNFLELKSLFTQQTWPAFRTYGLSALLPWDQDDLFKTVPGASVENVALPADWDHLQRPGISPDYLVATNDWLTCVRPQGRFEPTSLGKTFQRVNRETLAYIAGAPERFTAKDHVFAGGGTITKQVVILNDLRKPADADYTWQATVNGKPVGSGSGKGRLEPGGKLAEPLRFAAPAADRDEVGSITLTARVNGRTDETLRDSFSFSVLPPAAPVSAAQVACDDPKGMTAKLLRDQGVPFTAVQQPVPPSGCSLFVIGREALTVGGPPVDLEGMVKGGATVLVFEQTEEVLQQRFGFRTASPGTRRVFVRQPSHPVCAGLTDDLLRDWRGSSTLVDAYPNRTGYYSGYPRETWCGFGNSRTWQWGNYGTVASVLLEKPQRGNWSFPLDCEFDLQYAPLAEWLTPQGRTLFCQLDLTGRDRPDPAAERVLRNLLTYAAQPPRPALSAASYLGDDATRQSLAALGADLTGGSTLIVGPGADPALVKDAAAKADTVLCLGLPGEGQSKALPFSVATEKKEVSHTLIGRPTEGALVGLGDSDFHWRGRVSLDAITKAPTGFAVLDTGVFAEGTIGGKRYVFVQFLPTDFDYQAPNKVYLKLSFRRANLALARILTNCGVSLHAPVGERFGGSPPLSLDLSGEWQFTADPKLELKREPLSSPDFAATGWQTITAPGTFESQVKGLANYDGFVWYRKVFELPNTTLAPGTKLCLGAIDDEDWTSLNGKLIGHIGQDTNPDDYWSAERAYALPAAALRPGKNVLLVKVTDLRQTGGLVRGPLGVFEPGRWLDSYYLDTPANLDDPYRYNRW